LEKLLGEQELGLSGTIEPVTAAKVGQLTGAKVLVTGRLISDGDQLTAVAKIMGVETSRVYGEIARGTGAKPLEGLAEELADKIAKRLAASAHTLVAATISREARIAKLIESLPQGKRPAVAVKIPEHHFGRPAVDPAAATELMKILDQAGFTIVDEQSKGRPDIEITGEAFSALGTRQGNLISCKARIELKVRDLNKGKILAVDRQTSVAVDITEQTAAKSALENGAVQLAERILPKLL